MKVLLVSEDAVTRSLMKGLLAKRGHDVTTCRDSEKGWEQVNRDSFGLVVLQSDLTGMDGLRFCRYLRALPDAAQPSVLLMTAPGAPKDLREVAESGADDFVARPLDLELVGARLALLEARADRAEQTRDDASGEQEIERSYRQLLESHLVGIGVSDGGGIIHAANDAFLFLIDRDRNDLNRGDISWVDLVPADQAHAFSQGLDVLKRTGLMRPREFDLVRRDRTRIPVLVGLVPHREAAGQCVAFVLDVTELKREDELQRQTERMEVMGQLARGIEQHFNNLLTTITGYSEILLMDLDPLDLRHEYLQEIRRAADQAAMVTRQLLVFSRGQVVAPRVLDLNGVVLSIEKMLRRLLGRDVELVLNLSANLGRIRADLVQLEKIVLNLAVNARDAMPEGGVLTIETANVVFEEDLTRAHIRPGSYVMLSVRDTGHGMDSETQSRIFEPFFTTRPIGTGIGLGLAVVHGVVQQSHGHVSVSSAVGEGTRFEVYFPMVEPGVDSRADDASPQLPRGLETILLVENEGSVRAFARMVLTRCGYNVLEASNATRAVRVCRETEAPIHLLVTDLVMPRMGGDELAERVAGFQPDIKVMYVYSSGDDPQKRRAVLAGDAPSLEKPFTPAALARKVREVLDSPRATLSPS